MNELFTAARRAVMYARWNVRGPSGFQVCSTKEDADQAYATLCDLMERGSDPNVCDADGVPLLLCVCRQTWEIIPHDWNDDCRMTEELEEDLTRIFRLLLMHGADPTCRPAACGGHSIREHYADTCVGAFLRMETEKKEI